MIPRDQISDAFRNIRGVRDLEWREFGGGQAIVRLRFHWWAWLGVVVFQLKAYSTARAFLDANAVYNVLIEVW